MPEPTKPKRSLGDLHKTNVAKVKQMSNKMARHLMTCETSLPRVKRDVGLSTYNRLRDGLLACREVQSGIMDELEDLKILGDDEEQQQQQIESLQKLAKTLQEHTHSLLEAFNSHQHREEMKTEVAEEHDGDKGAT